MAFVSIKLVKDSETGERKVEIDYTSDQDAMAYEHDDDHTQFVNKLFGCNVKQVRQSSGYGKNAISNESDNAEKLSNKS